MKKTKQEPEIHVWKNVSKRKYIYSYSSRVISDTDSLYVEGGSCSVNENIAKDKAVYEAVERTCGSQNTKKLPYFRYDDISKEIRAVNPQKFIFFPSNQYKKGFLYEKYHSKHNIQWVKATSLLDNKKVFIPAFTVFLGYNEHPEVKYKYFPTPSTGLSVHQTRKKSAINSILELIERNNAMQVWLSKKNFSRIDLARTKSSKLNKLLRNIDYEGLNVEVVCTTQDILIPSFISVVYSRKKNLPYATFGMSCAFNVLDGILKSIEEALMVRASMEYLKEAEGANRFNINSNKIHTFFDHCVFYASHKNKKNWKFLSKGPKIALQKLERKFKKNITEKEKYEFLVSTLKNKGCDAYVVNLDCNLSEWMDLKCTKVIIPDLRQMEISNNYRFHGCRRNKNKEVLENPTPHPFG